MFATPTQNAVNAPHSPLERQLIIDFLASKGYCLDDIHTLPGNLARELMVAACTHASLRLAEIEARSQFSKKIHAVELK